MSELAYQLLAATARVVAHFFSPWWTWLILALIATVLVVEFT